MKVLIKDLEGNIIYKNNAVEMCEVYEDEYDFTKFETTTGSLVMNDIKVMKTYRLLGSPKEHQEENHNFE